MQGDGGVAIVVVRICDAGSLPKAGPIAGAPLAAATIPLAGSVA